MNKTSRQLRREFKPKSQNQADYIRSIAENELVFCVGPAGSGKTAVAVGVGIEYLISGKCAKLIITRPTVSVGDKKDEIGFLPGDIREKMDPYLVPIFDELVTYLPKPEIEELIRNGEIEIAPLNSMRGRTFHDSLIIVDEGQNLTHTHIVLLTTRIGSRSKMVINGDTEQHDRHTGKSPLEIWIRDIIKDDDMIAVCEMDETDIVRSNIVKRVLSLIKKWEDSKNV